MMRAQSEQDNACQSGRSSDGLHIEDLRVYYWTDEGPVKAVDGVSLRVRRGERFGIVGESGCGKSTTVMAVLRLLSPSASIEGGRICLDGTDILGLSEKEMRTVRLSTIALIPQGAMNSLNPVMKVGRQIADAIRAHEGSVSREQLRQRIEELLEKVGLAARARNMYPHELSGGMKQRACIAVAIALKPKVIIADEPTSALDVVVQRLVIETLVKACDDIGASLIIIGHDMGLQAQTVERLAVMYAGKVAEVGGVRQMFKDPFHPYSRLLIASVPSIQEKKILRGIPGLPPRLLSPPPGCIFHPRCPDATDVCRREEPELKEVEADHLVACHLYREDIQKR